MKSAVFLLGLFCVSAAAQTAKAGGEPEIATKPDHALITSMTSESFQKFVQAMGFECTRGKTDGKDDSFFTFRAEGYKVAAFFHDPSYLLLYNAFNDVNPTLATVNEWNQKNNFSRAYVDKDGNAVLESDLVLTGGVATETVELFIKTFRDSVARWARFALDRKK
jgi:hypothetical protein